ncbi:hypothetical protein E4P40_22415 [Blastococcus sp. CT_GayMR20]|uniref:hypothetical protein n=1 Tax=Blastococcus sp. CT_GayMR20 TaxID=2559609 RepID=UPI00107367E0|nr:hypothetical protein [Blastococcus sp. CT_GayMR20]TFV69282.1 hypothetical protein E4P40_22415 [Blastococcus sp. CT_GayMR20]
MRKSSRAGAAVKPVVLERRLAGREFDQLWTLVVAAGAAPGVRHRWATVGHLVRAVIQHERRGTLRVRAGHLEGHLAACVAEEPSLLSLEDFLPADPRDIVVARLGTDIVRLFPGSVERPLADVDRALLVAQAVDGHLVDQLGFGVADVVELGLRYADLAIDLMRSAWPSGELPGEGPVVLTDAEFEAAQQLVALQTPPILTRTPTLRRALEWMTCDASALPYRPESPDSVFGRFLRVTTGGTPRWLPLAFLPECLGRAVTELAATAARTAPAVNDRFAQLVAARVREALWRFSPIVMGPEDVDGLPPTSTHAVQWVMQQGPRRALLVQVAASLNGRGLRLDRPPAALTAIKRRRTAPTEILTVSMARGKLTVHPEVETAALFVVAGAGHLLAPQHPEMPGMSLEDLRWAATSAVADTDLYTFCRDLSRAGRPDLFGWEAINIWEWWQSNGKSLIRGGQAPTMLMIAPHHGEAEWRRGAEQAELEQALVPLGLAPLRDCCATDRPTVGPPAVYYWASQTPPTPPGIESQGSASGSHERPPMRGWTMHISAVPVAIAKTDPEWATDAFHLLHDLSGALAFGLGQVDAAWQDSHHDCDTVGYRLALQPAAADRRGEHRIWLDRAGVEAGPRGPVCVGVLNVALEAFGGDAVPDMRAVHEDMAAAIRDLALAGGASPHGAEDVLTLWQSAPPTLAIRAVQPVASRQRLVSAIALEDALVADMDRRVAEAVHESGVHPGDYIGRDAKDLDRAVLAPAALAVLSDRLSAHNMDELLAFGMIQLERCVADRERVLRSLEQSAALLSVEWDPVERHREVAEEYLLLRRCIETTIEAALRLEPRGPEQVDALAWMELTAAARAYLSATMRSESVHHQVSPVGLRVSETFELSTFAIEWGSGVGAEGDEKVYDLAMTAFGRTRAELRLALDTDSDHSSDPAGDDGPVDAAVDAALLQEFGASGMDVLTTLFALAQWPLDEEDDDTIVRAPAELVDYLIESTVVGDDPDGPRRLKTALDLLTSRSADLQAAEWKPWHARSRKRRLLVQPLPQLSDGRLIVAPHWCLASLAVYRNYLSQGQLPWSQPPAPRVVDEALAQLRARRNKALESAVAVALRSFGWTAIENVKETKPERLGVPALAGEIDCVAGHPDSHIIWLLEVKDPVDTHATPDIRRSLDAFFKDTSTRRSYATQLRRKYEDLIPYTEQVAGALGLPERPDSDPYVIRPMFVTRWPTAAAFVTSPFPFMALPQLRDRLRQGQLGLHSAPAEPPTRRQ